MKAHDKTRRVRVECWLTRKKFEVASDDGLLTVAAEWLIACLKLLRGPYGEVMPQVLTSKNEICYDTNSPDVHGLSVSRCGYVNMDVDCEYSEDVPPFRNISGAMY